MIFRPKNLLLFLIFCWWAAAPTTAAAIQVKTLAFGPHENRGSYATPSLGLYGKIPIVRIAQDTAAQCETLAGQ